MSEWMREYCHVLGWLTRRVLDWMIRFIYTLYIHTIRDYRQLQRYRYSIHTFQFTVTQALGFSAFTSRILATDLSQSHCHFNPHMKSSWHSLIPFLTFLLSHLRLPSPELGPILFLLDYCSVLYFYFRSWSWSYVTTDGQLASPSWRQAPIWDLTPDVFLSVSCGFVDVGRPLWREDGSEFYNVQCTIYLHFTCYYMNVYAI
jgi:hypothetical protein